MKKTHKKILGFFGLGIVAAMTAVAVVLPSPGVSALSSVTDTVVIRVVGEAPDVGIDGVESGTVTINPDKTLSITYENVGRVRVQLTYKSLVDGTETVFDLADEMVDYNPGSFPLILDLSESQYGYGDYTVRVFGEGTSGTDEDIVRFTYTPFDAELKEDEKNDKTDVDLEYIDTETGSDEDRIGKFIIEVYDKGGKLVSPLSPITALPPATIVNLPFEKYDLEAGLYTIKITAYNRDDEELTVRYLVKEIKEGEVIPVPDTGRIMNNLNISKADFLVSGLIVFLAVGLGGILYINKRSKKNSRKR